jgi:hypothetical protein
MAVNSSKLLKLSSSQNSGNKSNFDVGKIDPRILKILGVSEFDIEDEQEYLSLLKEKMLLIVMGKSKLSREDEELITEELKRIRSKKFPKKKKITADSFKKGTAAGINLNLGKKLGAGMKPLALPPAIDKMSGKNDLEQIQDALTAIIEQLTILNSLTKKSSEKDRREKENARRGAREKDLESGFSKALNIAEKVIAPVKSILQRIIDFFLAVFIGRSLILLLEWFNNPANKKKVDTILRFLGDHWPKLLALFVAFGTGLGGFARGIIKLAIWGTGALIKAAAGLAARAGIKGAAGALKFLGGPKGKLIGMGLELAAVAGGTFALSKGIEGFGGIGGEKEEQPQTPKAQFSGGGFANLKNLFGNMGGFSNGMVGGPKGTDKVPAMLTDGEFVMSRGAVAKYGVDTLEGMNAAGGGNNKPKVVQGTTYAAGGGMVGKPDKPELTKQAKANNEYTPPNVSPTMSSQEDMNKVANQITINERLKRIENQIQVNLAISSGKGINIKGATSGAQLGTGHSATYQGRNSFVIKGGAKNFSTGIGDREITLGGKRYYAQKKGDDVIYSLAKSGGSLMGGSGLKSIDKSKLPPTQIMMGGDKKPYVGFLTFEKGQPVYKQGAEPGAGTTNPLEALGRWLNPNSYKENDDKLKEKKKREAEVNSLEYYKNTGMKDNSIQRQMKMTGQNYGRASNDLKHRQTQAQLAKPSKPKPPGITPPSQSQARVTYVPNKNTKRNVRGGGTASSAKPNAPKFNAASPTVSKARFLYGVRVG